VEKRDSLPYLGSDMPLLLPHTKVENKSQLSSHRREDVIHGWGGEMRMCLSHSASTKDCKTLGAELNLAMIFRLLTSLLPLPSAQQ
jgi:hypothetical protein